MSNRPWILHTSQAKLSKESFALKLNGILKLKVLLHRPMSMSLLEYSITFLCVASVSCIQSRDVLFAILCIYVATECFGFVWFLIGLTCLKMVEWFLSKTFHIENLRKVMCLTSLLRLWLSS